ncbi:MAG: hypothetical protein IKW62_01645 [Clostridia bacterium]|nr:hypothetical protein [Clostridia bacterium]
MEKTKLKAKLKETGITVRVLAKKSGILRFLLYFKLCGLGEFTLDEMRRIAKALDLTELETAQIFF